MATDICVTTPKSEMTNAALEAEQVKQDGGGRYFRSLANCPKGLEPGESRVYYVEDGYIRGYAVVCALHDGIDMKCDTTGRTWTSQPKGCVVYMNAASWRWIRPIKQHGFQGWRYFNRRDDTEEIGGWLDPKPNVIEWANKEKANGRIAYIEAANGLRRI